MERTRSRSPSLLWWHLRGPLAIRTAHRRRLTGRQVTVVMDGGELEIDWRASDDHVLMTGTATFEYEGRFDPALFASVA